MSLSFIRPVWIVKYGFKTYQIMWSLCGATTIIAMKKFESWQPWIFGSFSDEDDGEKPLMSKLVIYVIYLMVFTCLPSFILVIVGVINCVSQWNSTRMNPVDIRLAQKLDKRYNIVGMLLVIATVAKLILDMAQDINAYEDQSYHLKFWTYVISRLVDFLLLIFPIMTCCVFGKRCCCWCCCNACQPPLDELE